MSAMLGLSTGIEAPVPDRLAGSPPSDAPPADRTSRHVDSSCCGRVPQECIAPGTVNGRTCTRSCSLGSVPRRGVDTVHILVSRL